MAIKYHINLVRVVRLQERKVEAQRWAMTMVVAGGLAILTLALLHMGFQILQMNMTIAQEEIKLKAVEHEYSQYQQATKQIEKVLINKADIELLDNIQHGRIFWTKKLVAMAHYLPEEYWITSFGYDQNIYNVKGYGYISPAQEQLISVDDYLNNLRADTTYCDNFPLTYLNATTRNDEQERERVTFEFSSQRAVPKL